MGNPKTATSRSRAATSQISSTQSGEQRFSSSSDLWPEVAPDESSRRAAHRKKSLTTSRDQLLYLQALFPYAPYDELMGVIRKTDGPDEAAQHAYEALNPNYTGYLYLKEQTDVMNDTKATKAQRETAFNGLKEALEERATDAFRPGMFSNLSQLQEYHETVGLFAIDTTEWDRAMMLPARDMAEMAFMDLPLREEPSSPSSSSSPTPTHSCSGEGNGACASHDYRPKPRVPPLALHGGSTHFMDSSFLKPSGGNFDAALLSPQTSPTVCQREKRGSKPRDGCKTPIASPAARESAQQQQQQPQQQNSEDVGVLYLQDSDPKCKAPIIAWAPEAIRVGPAEALRQQEGALRVFDEATFFSDPLVAHHHSPILLQTPAGQRAQPADARRSTVVQTGGGAETVEQSRSVTANSPQLLAVSPNPSPRVAAVEWHEPIDSPTDSLPYIGDEDDEEQEEEGGEEGDASRDGAVKDGGSGNTVEGPIAHVVCDPTLLGADRDNASTTVRSRSSGVAGEYHRRSTAEHHPDFVSTTHSDASTHLVMQPSLRETTVETLKSRKRRPLTSSEKVKQRMRKLKPVGNLVFLDNAESAPTAVLPGAGGGALDDDAGPNPMTAAAVTASPSVRVLDGGPTAAESTLRTEDDVYTNPSAGTLQADWTTRNSRCNDDPSQVLKTGPPASGSAGAAATNVLPLPSSSVTGNCDRVCGQAVSIPSAHVGCSSLDLAAYLNSEEERLSCIVEMLKPFEDIFGAKFRCELVRCIYDDCRAIRTCLQEIMQRLLHVVSLAMVGKEVAEGLSDEPLDLPLFGSILLSTSAVKLEQLCFRESKCELRFCEEGTRLRVRLNVKKVKFEPIQFAYIDEADAARQNRTAQQMRRKMPPPRSRAAAWTLRHNNQEKYQNGITRGTATIGAANIKLKGIVYVWLMASGKVYVTFQEAKVSVGSFSVSTDVTKLNVLFTLGAPILKLMVERMMLDAVKGVHAF
jgi:hypothetical protein